MAPPEGEAAVAAEAAAVAEASPAAETAEATGAAAAAADGGAGDLRAEAAERKAEGNGHFKAGEYREALACYTDACEKDPSEPVYLGNKSAAEFQLRRYGACVATCDAALALKPEFHKCAVRRAKARTCLGDLEVAETELLAACEAHPGEASLAAELAAVRATRAEWSSAEAALASHDAHTARVAALKVRGAVSESVDADMLLARCELGCGRAEQASKVCLGVIREHRSYVPAYCVRGKALCALADLDQAEAHLSQALRMDPDHTESARTLKRMRTLKRGLATAKEHVFRREFDEAAECLTTVLDNELVAADKAPGAKDLRARTYAERANCYQRSKQYERAIKDCAHAIYADPRCKEAYLTRSNALQGLGRHDDAISDLELVVGKLDPEDKGVHKRLERAKFELRKSKRPDYYKILGASTIASAPEIKAAYKKAALKWHPDRHASKGEEERAQAEEEFKKCGEALEVLSDPRRKQLYDEGYDKEASDEIIQREQMRYGGCCGGHC